MTDTDNSAAAAMHDEIAAIVRALQDAWNAADGSAFAASFAPDADFVNVYGMHVRGKDAIEQGHNYILRNLYAGSVNRYDLESARLLRPDVALAHVQAALQNPAGPLAGDHQARFSMVLTRAGDRWQIDSFHNTFITSPGGPPQ